jgi:gliding motility-associated-like protein
MKIIPRKLFLKMMQSLFIVMIFFTGKVNAQCSITAISAGTQTACNPLTNYYTQQVTVTYSNAPGVGTLNVNGQTFGITGSPQTVTLTNLSSNGAAVNVTASFSDDISCTYTQPSAFTAPVNCLPNQPGVINNFTDCNPGSLGIPNEFLDYSSNPDTTSSLILDFDSGQGECCNLSSNQNCYHVEIYLSPESEGISFNFAGASGSFYIYEPCSNLETAAQPNDNAYTDIISLGGSVFGINEVICVDGVGPHEFMICRPGGAAPYTIQVVSYPTPTGSGDLAVTEGCFIDLNVLGLTPASIIWNSTSPGTTGQWNNLLSGGSANGTSGVPYATAANGGVLTTGATDVVVTPILGSPSTVTYQVCGYPLLSSVCTTDPPVLFCASSTITIYPDLFADAGPDVAICAGAAPGTTVASTAAAIGGTPPFTFNWQGVSGAATGFNYTTVSSDATETVDLSLLGTYTLTITDANNCATATDQITVFNYDTQIQSFITSPAVSICYTPTPTINLAGYVTETNQGVWSTPTSGTFGNANVTSGVAPGTATTWIPTAGTTGVVTFTLTPTNNLGCPITPATIDINLTEFTSALTAVPSNVTCFGLSNGSVNLTVTPGTPAYATASTVWSNSAITEDLSGLLAGTYSVVVTDVNGCTGTTSAIITQPAAALTVSATQTNILCFGASTGAIDLTPVGGTPPYTYDWNNDGTGDFDDTQDLSSIPAGTYTVVVNDALGSTGTCTATTTVTVTQPAAPVTLTTTQTDVLCFGASTGAINLTPSGGSGVYTYDWSNDGTGDFNDTQDLSSLPAGSYTVVVRDANGTTGGCTATATVVITQPAAPLSIPLPVQTNILCFGGSTGAIDITPAGGTPTYNYAWTTVGGSGLSATSQDQTGLTAGSYTVVVTDANGTTGGCTATATVVITQPAAPLSIPLPVQTNILCFGGSTGAIDITPAGGTPTYNYAWTTVGGSGLTATAQDQTGLTAGSYTVVVTDANGTTGGCTATATVVITEPAAPLSIPLPVQTNVLCFGGSTGAIDITPAGGTPTYNYAWTTVGGSGLSAGAQDQTGLTAGSYTVVVTDANGTTGGCTATATVVITQPAAPLSIPLPVQTNILCFGGSTGAIDITPAGGTPTYNYAWTTVGGSGLTAGAQDQTGLTAGSYTVVVTDANGTTGGCTATATVVITQPAAPLSIPLPVQTNVLCFGGSTGAIDITPAGGTPTYNYAWTTVGGSGLSATSQDQTGLTAGSYTVVVTDANGTTGGCTATATVVITQPAAPLSIPLPVQTNILCFGGSTGAIDITPAGGTPTYNYAWTTVGGSGLSATSQDQTGLTAGSYTVVVTDANGTTGGCTATATVVITEPAAPLSIPLPVQTNVLCFGGSTGAIDITPAGGTPTYNYAWTTVGGSGLSATAQDQTGLTAGSYTVVVTDANGTTGGCTATATVVITQPAAPLSIPLPVQTNILCFGGSTGAIDITPAGGTPTYNYAWTTVGGSGLSATSQDQTGLTAGSYTVVVTDANGTTGGCTATATVVITQPAAPLSIPLPVQTNILCFGGSTGAIDITPAGGTPTYNYAWTTVGGSGLTAGAQDQTGLTAGSYTVVVTDANGTTGGCTATATVVITEPAAPLSIPLPVQTNVLCFGGSTGAIDITPAGGTPTYNYAWTTVGGSGLTAGAQDQTGLTAGSYTVVVTDANGTTGGCTATATVVITQPTDVTLTSAVTTDFTGFGVSCIGSSNGALGSTPGGGAGGYTFEWENVPSTGVISAVQNPSGLPAGDYLVTVTDANGCTETSTVTITEPTDIVIDPLDPSIYAGGYNLSGCNPDGSIDMTLSGGTGVYTYSWNGGTYTTEDLSALPAGTYTVIATDQNGCAETATIILTAPNQMTTTITSPTFASGTNISCFGLSDGSIDLGVTGGTPLAGGGYTYSWTGPNAYTFTGQDPTGIPFGTYNVTITDANNCQVTTTITLTEPPIISVTSLVTSDYNGFGISCFGLNDGELSSTPVGGSGTIATDYTYSWDTNPPTGVVSTTQNPTGLPAGDYTITVADINGCAATSDVTITEPTIVTSLSSVTSNYNGFGVSCFGSSDGELSSTPGGGVTTLPYNFAWNTDPVTTVVSTQQNPTGLPTGSYTVTITDANGCFATTLPVTITEPTVVTAASLVTSDYTGFGVSCFGASDGSTGSTPGGGVTTLPYNFEWNTDPVTAVVSTTQNPTGLPAGDYTVTITDANGCFATTLPVTITEPTEVTATSLVTSDYTGFGVSCIGSSDGVVGSTPGGGAAGFTYEWNTVPVTGVVSTVQNPSGLPAGDYTVMVTDANGCFVTTAPITVTEPTDVTLTSAVTTDFTGFGVSCIGSSNGGLSSTPGGGAGGYAFEWENVPSTGVISAVQNPSGLPAGDYLVTVTDANGCTETSTVTITEPTDIVIDPLDPSIYAGGYNLSGCNPDGSIDMTLSGGTGVYTYSWNGGTYTTEDLSALPAGTYTVIATDQNGCTETATIILTAPNQMNTAITSPTYASGDNISCFGFNDGSIDLTITGGTPLSGGGYTYSWTGPGGFTSSDEDPGSLIAGVYNVTITDANDCEITSTITLTEPVILTQAITSPTYASGDNISCFGFNDGSIDYTVGGGSGGYTFDWTTADGTGLTSTTEDQGGLTFGTYDVTMTDLNGCILTTTITLTEPTILTQAITSPTYASGDNISCFGFNDGSIDYTVGGGSGGYTFDWTTADGTGLTSTTEDQGGLTFGTYDVTMTDLNGCILTTTITLTEPTILTQAITSPTFPSGDNISCFGFNDGSIDYTVGGGSGGYTFDWTTADGTGLTSTTEDQGGLTFGTYDVTMTDLNGCILTTTITLTEPTILTQAITSPTFPSGDNISCFGFNDGSIDYTVGGGSGGYTFDWTTADGTGLTATNEDQSGLTFGTYDVTMTDLNGCILTTTITLTEPTVLTSSVDPFVYPGGFNVTGCNPDGSIDLTVVGGSAGYEYLWSPGGSTTEDISSLAAGTYDVTVTDINGCITTSTVTLTAPNGLTQAVTSPTYASGDNISCFGFNDGSIDLTITGGTPGYTYDWSGPGGFTSTSEDPGSLIAGTYDVTVTDVNGCEITSTITLTEPVILTQAITSPTYASGDNISCFGFNDGSIDYTVGGGSGGYTFDWTTADGTGLTSTTEDQGGLTFGTYDVTMTDLNGCILTTTITLTEPTILTQAITSPTYASGDNISCFGFNDGSIDYTVGGGSGGYTFDWTTADGTGLTSTTEDQGGLTFGTYDVTMTDLNGCILTTTITLTEPTILTQAITSPTYASGDNISCFGFNDGSIDYTVGGGSGGYTFDWTTADGTGLTATNEDQSGLTFGTYDVTMTDLNGCILTTTITLTEPVILTQAITSPTFPSGDNISCFGFNDGSIDYTVGGGSGGYTFDWTTADGTGLSATNEDQSGLTFGTYDVTMTDLNGCILTTTITLTEPTVLTSSVDPFVYPGGFNVTGCNPDGSIDLTVVGGSAGYEYLWSPGGSTTEDISSLAAGTYDVTVTDINGCITTSTVTLTAPNGLTQAVTSPTYASGDNISCFGFNDGSIDLTITGGTPGYTYDWSGPGGFTSTSEDPGSLIAGTYDVTVTDVNGCEITSTITLTEPVILTQAITSPTYASGDNISCFGFNDGSIDYTVGGGSGGYTFDWTTADGTGLTSTTEDQGGLTFGTYDVTMTDLNGCILTTTITLTEPTILTQAITSPTYASGDNISCFGFNDGSIDYTVGGGSGGYTFDWTTADGTGLSATNEDQGGLTFGTYDVTMTDLNGCILTTTITLTEPTILTQAITSPTYASGDNISCFGFNDGSIDYTVGGGSGGYTFDWTTADGTGLSATNEDQGGLTFGTYDVTMTDLNGCILTTTITLTEPVILTQAISAFEYPSTDNISCFGFNDGSIDYTVGGGSPGYTYSWTTANGSGLIDGLEDQTNLTAGTYNVLLTDINGCQQTITITLVEPTPLVINLTPSIYSGGFNLSGCQPDGWIDATVNDGSPGYTYSWSPGLETTEDIANLPEGTYTVTATDINGCIIIDEITLIAPELVTVTTAVTTNYNGQDITCTGASDGGITSTPSGGAAPYTYEWTNSTAVVVGTNQSVNNLPSGTYSVLVTDDNGCTTTEVITLVDPPLTVIAGSVSTDYNGQDVSCFGSTDGGITLDVQGGTPGFNYTWRDEMGNLVSNNQNPTDLGAGTYEVFVTDANNCLTITQVTLTQPELLVSEALVTSDYNGQDVSCFQSTDGSVIVNASGGTPGYTYNWTSGGTSIGTSQELVTIVGAGVYNVLVTDINNCLSLTSVTVTEPTLVTSNISIISNYFGAPVSCVGAEDGIVEVNYAGGTPGYSVSWNTNPEQTTDQAINMPEGTFTATITDANGCISTSEVFLWANPLPDFDLPESVYGCIGSPITIDAGATPGTNCEWTFSNGMVIDDCGPFSMSFDELACFDMQLVLTTPTGCRDTISTTDFICVKPNPVASFTISEYDLYTTDYDAYFFNVSEGADSYIWNFGDESPTSTEVNPYHQFPTEGYENFEIWLWAISEFGCVDSTVRYIRFHPELIYYVPNTFTPDGDDFNNIFKPVISSGYSLENFNFMIFNRWGELIYESNDISTVGWDGTYRGNVCQEGVYTWKLQIMNSDTDRKEEAVGHVSLLRGAGL